MRKKALVLIGSALLMMSMAACGKTASTNLDSVGSTPNKVTTSDVATTPEATPSIEPQTDVAKSTAVTVVSNAKETDIAVAEGIAGIKEKVNAPSFIVVYGNPMYDYAMIATQLSTEFPNAEIIGASSSNEVISDKGITDGLVMLATDDANLTTGVALGEFDTFNRDSVVENTATVLSEAIADAGKTVTDVPTTVYVLATAGAEEYAIASIQDVLGKEVPIYGGTPSDGGNTEAKSTLLGGEETANDGISIAVFYGETKVGSSFKAGFVIDETKSVEITKMESPRTLTEVNGKPASEELIALSEGGLVEETTDSQSFYTLAKLYKDAGNMSVTTAFDSLVTRPDKIGLFTNLAEGEEVYLVKASRDAMLGRVKPMVLDAYVNGGIKKDSADFGLSVLCQGARSYMGDDLQTVVDSTNAEFGGKPWVGIVSAGEQGFVEGYGSFHGNYMHSMSIFGN